MSFLDRFFGRDGPNDDAPRRQADPRTPDEIALERYRYLLQTAPPEDIEQAHAEAFSRLTPEQRRLALQQLAAELPESEARAAGDDPRSLARLATRAELRQPGTIERAFGRPAGQGGAAVGGGMGGFGGPGIGSILLYSIAGSFIGTAIAQSFFADHGYPAGDPGGDPGGAFATAGDTGAGDVGAEGHSSGGSWDGGSDGADYGTADADLGGGDLGGGDFGGGDFGGGDFGGGDFGGGDFG